MSKYYLLTFDTPPNGTDALHGAIDKSSDILAWWHYIDNSYIIYTNVSAQKIFDSIKPTMGNASLLIIKIDPHSDKQGWLPNKAWTWFKRINPNS